MNITFLEKGQPPNINDVSRHLRSAMTKMELRIDAKSTTRLKPELSPEECEIILTVLETSGFRRIKPGRD